MYRVPRRPWTATPLMRAALIGLTLMLVPVTIALIDPLKDIVTHGGLPPCSRSGLLTQTVAGTAYVLMYAWTVWRPRWWRAGLGVVLLWVIRKNM